MAYCHYHPCLTYIFLAADSEEEAEQSDSAVDDEHSPSEEDNTQDLVDRTRGELGAAIRDAAGTAAGSFIFHSSKFQCIIDYKLTLWVIHNSATNSLTRNL
jgi:hypothetical protein